GFPAQKMVFLPKGAPAAAIATYTKAFRAVHARSDFAKISAVRLGKYPQMTGDMATATLKSGTNVPVEAKAFVLNWLKERYGVTMK
ncbi:MAG: tricarboxylate transporter, partial [Deltaproteobacteria bacterium]|nr:tricarboxylate transporter [Deltaproteobacteria bacterium]